MSQSPEKTGVETPAIESLRKLGYTHLPGNAVQVEHRHLAPVLEDVLRSRLLALNPWLATAPGGVDAALIELRKRVNDDLLPANKAFWEQVVHRSDIQVKDAEGKPRSVRFFDAGTVAHNDFHVVDQYVGRNADGDLFRPDLLVFVNGLPLATIECKANHHRLDEALSQLDGYQASFPAQFVFNQVCVGLNRRQGLYGAILTKPAFYARYRLQDAELAALTAVLGADPSEQDQLLWALFEPGRFLELITHFVLFETRDGRTVKKLPRYQQWRAVHKTIARLTTDKPIGGVVWHTQGSGKSLTMALLARMLRADSTGLGNPTVLVLTDRKELDKQIFDTFHAVGIKAIQAVSVDGLVKLLGNDYGSVFTSTVQKFQENEPAAETSDSAADEEDDLLQATRHRRVREGKDFFMVEERNANYGQHDEDGVLLDAKWEEVSREKVNFRVLSAKPNFYVLVDEAHRSQYDFLAAFMRASLPNAKFIAFTGTPLLNDDKHTLAEFGGDTYIDEYSLVPEPVGQLQFTQRVGVPPAGISYYGRARDESSERKVSPQQLLHYRGNWYLIAYCHVRHGLRSFAMDSIQAANATQETAFEADAAQLEKFIGAGYGIYSGGDVQWARLRFTAPRSRWVAREVWHPEQKSQLASDGTLLLEVPFTDATELAMDILRHGKHVEVLEPQALREAVMHELVSASAMYSP